MVATRAVMPALRRSGRCELVAVAAAGGSVANEWAVFDVGTYDAVLEDPAVDVVYVPLPNGLHEHWVARAAAAGKHVLCEKPLGPDAASARRMATTCERAGVLLAEAWMTPFDPRWAQTVDMARSGRLGDLQSIDAAFTFTIGSDGAANYRWDPSQGGGALLDVGIYCLGAAVDLWGASPSHLDASALMSETGVDSTTRCLATWPHGRTASIQCSFVDADAQHMKITGSLGSATLDGDAFTGGTDARRIDVTDATGRFIEQVEVIPADPYLGMVDAFAKAVRGIEPWQRPVTASIAMLELLDRIAANALSHSANNPEPPTRQP
jgi:D-xylose 1-dehydrogenase (NADP+, D-xylono-1,5-lactone-forming)